MGHKIILVISLMVFSLSYSLGQQFQLQGMVTNENGKPLVDIAVEIPEVNQFVFTSDKGIFSFDRLMVGKYTILIDSYGNDPFNFFIELNRDTFLPMPFIIEDKALQLQEVVINSKTPVGTSIESLPALEMNAAEIRRTIGGSLMQTLEKFPGIKSIGIGSSNAKPLIRGLGFNQVAVIENGIKHEGQEWGADHGLELDQYAVDKLEVIKGPASFLYGSDALGGIINIKSNSPPQKYTFGGSIDLVGKSNNLHAGGSIHLYGRKEHWFYNIRSTRMRYADYRVPVDTVYIYSYAVNVHRNFVRNTAGNEWSTHVDFGYISNRMKSTFSISNHFNKSGFFANAHGILPVNVDQTIYDASNRDINLPFQQVNHLKISNQTSLYLDNHVITIDVGFQNNFRTEYSKYVAHGYMPAKLPIALNLSNDLEREYDKNVITLNVSDKLSINNHSLSFGISAGYQQNKIGGWGFLIPGYHNVNLGGFIFDKFEINKHWSLSGAIRYDFGQIRVQSYSDWFESEVEINGIIQKVHLQKAPDFEQFFNNLSWSAGVVYTQNKWTIHANIGKSFRMPIAKELAGNGVNYHYFRYEKGNVQLSPEQSYQIDLGVSWNNEQWSFNATPFVNYFSNYIFLNPTSQYDTYYGAGNQIFEYTQANVFRTGFELLASYSLTDPLKIATGIEYLYNIQLSGEKRYYPLPFSPPTSGVVSLTFTPKIWSKILKETFVKADVKLALAQNNIVPPEKKTPAYCVTGFSVGSSLITKQAKIDFSISVFNLFNQKYLNHTSFYRLIELPEQGRNIVLSVKVPFDFK